MVLCFSYDDLIYVMLWTYHSSIMACLMVEGTLSR